MHKMPKDETLDRFKDAARTALEAYLAALTLPSLMDYGSARPLELTLHASLRTSGPLPEQTLELVATPLKVRTESTVLTTGAALPVKTPRLEDYFSPSDLKHIDDILES